MAREQNHRWDFLLPWLDAVDFGYAGYLTLENEQQAWDTRDCRLRVIPPSRSELCHRRQCVDSESFDELVEKEFCQRFRQMREGVALLATAAYFDKSALRYLFETRYGMILGQPGEERYERHIPASFLLLLTSERTGFGCESFESILLRFFGNDLQDQRSTEYLGTLTKIAEMYSSPRLRNEGVEIRIPMKVLVEKSMINGVIQSALRSISKVQNMPREACISIPGQLCCNFVMEPMVVDIGSHAAKTMSQLVRANTRFSQVSLCIGSNHHLWRKEVDRRSVAGRRMSAVFDTVRRASGIVNENTLTQHQVPNARQLDIIDVRCREFLQEFEIEALFSAITVCQTSEKVQLDLTEFVSTKERRQHLWSWIAYGLFSERARAHSAVKTLVINGVGTLDNYSVLAFNAVLKSDHPEEELCAVANGAANEKDAVLKAKAPMRTISFHDRKLVVSSEIFTSPFPLNCVRTLGDDGETECVNALVPGYGCCQVLRNDLDLTNDILVKSKKANLLALTLGFSDKKCTELEKLPKFTKVMGPSLESLTLSVGMLRLNPNEILKYCPNLLQMSLIGRIVEMHLNFCEIRSHYKWPPVILKEWQSVPEVCSKLSNPKFYLTACVQRLRVHLDELQKNRGSYYRFTEADWKPLQLMLENNKVLTYLDVILPFECPDCDFSKYHLKPLDVEPKLLLETKLAFLSVLSSRNASFKITEQHKSTKEDSSGPISDNFLYQFAISNIFEFASEPSIRKVYCHLPNETSKHGEHSKVGSI